MLFVFSAMEGFRLRKLENADDVGRNMADDSVTKDHVPSSQADARTSAGNLDHVDKINHDTGDNIAAASVRCLYACSHTCAHIPPIFAAQSQVINDS